MGQVVGGLNIGISQGCFWDWEVVREELDRFGGLFGASFWNINLVASLVPRGADSLPTVNPMQVPGLAIGRGFKNKDLGSWRVKGGAIKIEYTIELGFN